MCVLGICYTGIGKTQRKWVLPDYKAEEPLPTPEPPKIEVTATPTPEIKIAEPESKEPVIRIIESTPEPTLEPEIQQPITNQIVQAGDMVYVPGFGWLESQGEGTVTHNENMYGNGNKVGIMG